MEDLIPSVDNEERDWYSLPARSLWSALHDAHLVRIASDPAAGSVTLDFRSWHLQTHNGIPEDARFLFVFERVVSVDARQIVPYPPFEIRQGESIQERRRREDDWHPAWRTESVGWPAFESNLSEEAYLDVMEAALATSEKGVILAIQGNYDSDVWTYIDIRAANLSVSRTDGEPFDLDMFIALGDAYWEAFANRTLKRTDE